MLLWPLFRVNIINEIAGTENWNNIESNDYVSTVALLSSFYFTLKLSISTVRFFNGNSLIVARRFRIQDSRFNKKSMKMQFQKDITASRKPKYESAVTLLWSFYFTQNFPLSYAGAFDKSFLSVNFRNAWNQNLKSNRFKNQSSDTLKILGHNCNHQQGLVK